MQTRLFGVPSLPRFRRVLMDPPWMERGAGAIKRGADRHYDLMPTKDIVELVRTLPEMENVEESAHCWIWVTDNFLEDGLEVMRAARFRYVRTMVWVKVRKAAAAGAMLSGQPLESHVLQIGLGQYLRGSHELCLFGVRGDAMVPEPPDRPPSVVLATRGEHSAKPDAAYRVIERVSPGPGLELFARAARPGWTAWGEEAPA